jgi:hypothetical protein
MASSIASDLEIQGESRAVVINYKQAGIAEVVGSNPTRFISFILVKYGIGMSSFLMSLGQKA